MLNLAPTGPDAARTGSRWPIGYRDSILAVLARLRPRASQAAQRNFAEVTTRRILLTVLGCLLVVTGFVLMAHSDGKLDRLVAVLVLFGGAAFFLFATSRPSREALARYWQKYEKK